MSQPFAPAEVVQIHRPGKSCDGWVGRYIEKDTHQSDFAWVAFGRRGATFAPPDEKHYKKADHTIRKLFPASHLVRPATPTERQ